jgi:hypothetical protein
VRVSGAQTVDRFGRQEDATEAVIDAPEQLTLGLLDIAQVQVRDGEDSVGRRGGEVCLPPVVGAAVGGQEVDVIAQEREDPDRRKDHARVDALRVVHGESRLRVIAALRAAVRVFHVAGEKIDRINVAAAEPREGAGEDHLLAHDELLDAIRFFDADRTRSVLRLEIRRPEISRLHHVGIGVDHHHQAFAPTGRPSTIWSRYSDSP